jgi:hypothetical protein
MIQAKRSQLFRRAQLPSIRIEYRLISWILPTGQMDSILRFEKRRHFYGTNKYEY